MRSLSLLLTLLAAAPAGGAIRFSLVVGNDIGRVGEPVLRWAEEDARRFHALLSELGAVAEGRGQLLCGSAPDQVVRAIERLRGQVEEARRQGFRTEVLVYYSGHGDASALHLRGDDLPIAALFRQLDEIPADSRVAILDACRSAPADLRNRGAVPGPAFEITLAREPGPSGRVLITSAGPNEVAQESDSLRGSFFTHHLLTGLRGAADTDRDSRVTLAELYAYAYNHTLAASHAVTAAVQHPAMALELSGEGELVMTELERARAHLTLAADLAGDVLLVDDSNSRVLAEVQKASGAPLTLALSAGRIRVQVRAPGRILAGEVELAWGGAAEVGADQLAPQELVAALSKGADLDPNAWALSASGFVGSPAALTGALALGGALGCERHLSGRPLFLRGTVALAHAANENRSLSLELRHLELRMAVGIGYGLELGPLRLAGTLDVGMLVVFEHTRRIDGVSGESDAVAMGPMLSPGLHLRIPIAGGLALTAAAEVPIAFLRIDEEDRKQPGWATHVGLEQLF